MRITFLTMPLSVEPLGVGYLSSSVTAHGHVTDLYVYEKNNASKEALEKYLKSFAPHVVAFSMTTGMHVELLELVRMVKFINHHIVTVVGGAHVTYFPDIKVNESVDYIIRGEADVDFPALIKRLENNDVPSHKDISSLKLPLELDKIPFPDRKLLYSYKPFLLNKTRNVMTSRGCPYNCSYCYSSVCRNIYVGQQFVRYRSAENIVQECEQLLRDYPTSMIFFADDEFSINYERLVVLSKLYRKRVSVPFHCQIRVDLLDEKRIKCLKDMGCYSLTFAIESGSERIRRHILNRHVTDNQIIEGAKLIRKYKIKFRTENIIGLPTETYDDVVATIRLNAKVKSTYAWVSLYQPYPRTELGTLSINLGLFNGNNDVIKKSFVEDTVLEFSKAYKKKIVRMQRLFSIACAFLIIRCLLSVLVRLPLTSMYTRLRNMWKKHQYKKLFLGV